MSGTAPKSSISWDSGQYFIECHEKSLFARLIIGCIVGSSRAGDRYTVDFLFRDDDARGGDGLAEFLHIRLCFADMDGVEYWAKHASRQAVLSLFSKSEFHASYLDAKAALLEDVDAIIRFLSDSVGEMKEHVEEMRTSIVPDDRDKGTLQ